MKEAILQPMTVAGHRIDRPIDRVRQYATTPILVRTLNEYDFANRGDCDRITVEEAGLRTRRIASRVSGREALWFAEHSTTPAARAAFRNVPADAALQDADPLIADELYDRANSLFTPSVPQLPVVSRAARSTRCYTSSDRTSSQSSMPSSADYTPPLPANGVDGSSQAAPAPAIGQPSELTSSTRPTQSRWQGVGDCSAKAMTRPPAGSLG